LRTRREIVRTGIYYKFKPKPHLVIIEAIQDPYLLEMLSFYHAPICIRKRTQCVLSNQFLSAPFCWIFRLYRRILSSCLHRQNL